MSVMNKKYQSKKYCNAKCHHQAMKKEYIYKCATCGTDVLRKKANLTSKVFCNVSCLGKYAGKLPRKPPIRGEHIRKICLECNKEYSVIYSKQSSKFCSEQCRLSVTSRKQRKRVEVICNNCNNKFFKVPSDIRNLNFCKSECMYNYYNREGLFCGEKSGTWNGGKKEYKGKNWLSQRRKARKRDNYTCQRCGITEEEFGQELSVHHKIPFVMFNSYLEANRLHNLECVCEPCHRKIHSGMNHPSKFKETFNGFFYGKENSDPLNTSQLIHRGN